MELTDHVKPAPKVENVRTYSPEEETTFVSMVNDGAYVEAIAEALDRSVNSVRGKALSLLVLATLTLYPDKNTKGSAKSDPLEELGDVSDMTVEAIAEAIGKTARGKDYVNPKRINSVDYDGAAKKEKAAS